MANPFNFNIMKKINLFLFAGLLAGILQACHGSKNSGTTDSTSTVTKTTDSTKVVTTDTSKMNSNADSTFAKKAAIGGITEVALGKVALTKASNTKIRDFAHMMVVDHGKANDELMGIAKKKNMSLPTVPDVEHQAKIDSLTALSGVDFDKAYINAMVEGHQKTLNLMQDEASNGKDADLKAFAAKTAPVVQMHLNAINKIHSNMK